MGMLSGTVRRFYPYDSRARLVEGPRPSRSTLQATPVARAGDVGTGKLHIPVEYTAAMRMKIR